MRIVSLVLDAAAAPPETSRLLRDRIGVESGDGGSADLVIAAFPAQAANAAFLDDFIAEANERGRGAAVTGDRWPA